MCIYGSAPRGPQIRDLQKAVSFLHMCLQAFDCLNAIAIEWLGWFQFSIFFGLTLLHDRGGGCDSNTWLTYWHAKSLPHQSTKSHLPCTWWGWSHVGHGFWTSNQADCFTGELQTYESEKK